MGEGTIQFYKTILPRSYPLFSLSLSLSSGRIFIRRVQKDFLTSFSQSHPTHKSSWYGASLFQLSKTIILLSAVSTWPSFSSGNVDTVLYISGG